MSLVLLKKEGFVGIVTINRPEALNAINAEALDALCKTLEEARGLSLRCLIVTGAGDKAFVAGADVSLMKGFSQEQAYLFSANGSKSLNEIAAFPAPVIAAVNGFALGGGCELALACDIRIASENANFAFPEVGLGIMPGWSGIHRLANLVGSGWAKELIFTAKRIDAKTALRIGLVNAVHPQSDLLAQSLAMAQKIADNAPVAVACAKQAFEDMHGKSFMQAEEKEARLFSMCFETEDQRQAMAAFVKGQRPAPFTGLGGS
jgi:enoyl-CoA hydratase